MRNEVGISFILHLSSSILRPPSSFLHLPSSFLRPPLMQGQIRPACCCAGRPNPATPPPLCLPSSIVCLPLLTAVLTFAFWLLTFDLTPPPLHSVLRS
jgi:hypothetical protein